MGPDKRIGWSNARIVGDVKREKDISNRLQSLKESLRNAVLVQSQSGIKNITKRIMMLEKEKALLMNKKVKMMKPHKPARKYKTKYSGLKYIKGKAI